MSQGQPSPKEFGYYLALAQVGTEMVFPVVVGVVVDGYLGWTPWALLTGAVVGFVGGMAHLLILVNRQERSNPSPPNSSPP